MVLGQMVPDNSRSFSPLTDDVLVQHSTECVNVPEDNCMCAEDCYKADNHACNTWLILLECNARK